MAIVYAVKTGNWSDTTVWNTGALPTSADDVYSNTFTVTIDTNPTVLRISNATTTGVTVGGTFVPINAITVTCTGSGVIAGTLATPAITSNLTTGQSFSIVSSLTGGGTTGGYACLNNSSGTVNIVGNCLGGSGTSAVWNNSTGTVNITGECRGGVQAGAGNSNGVVNNNIGTVNITGNCFGANSALGVQCNGAANLSTGNMTITGNLTGGINNSSQGAYSNTAGTMIITGTITATNAVEGFRSDHRSAVVILSGPFITSSSGINPVFATRWFWANSNVAPTYYQIRTQNLATIRPLYTADSVGGNPAISNVRSGTVYGPAGELTGTCAVPGASSVLSGVPIDNTTGTATIDAASIRSALGLASANLDTQLSNVPSSVWSATTRTITGGTVDTLTNSPDVPTEAEIASQVRTELTPELSRIANCATVATTGQQIQDALS